MSEVKQRKSAKAVDTLTPTQIDLNTGGDKEVIFRIINQNNRYLKGSLKQADIRFRKLPTENVPPICRVRYFFTKEEKEAALAKEGKKLPDSTTLTAYYNKGAAGYIEDLDLHDKDAFIASLDPILFTASPDRDNTLTPIRVCQPEEQELIWFLRTASYNEGSVQKHTEHRSIYYEHNMVKLAENSLADKKSVIKLMGNFTNGLDHPDKAVRDAVWTQHLAIAYSFGMDIFQSPTQVERQIYYLLENNAQAFSEAAANPANYKVFVLRMAERQGIIALDQTSYSFRWKSNNNFIVAFAAGSEPFMELAKWVQKPENMATYDKIKELWEESTNKGFGNYNAKGLVTPEEMKAIL